MSTHDGGRTHARYGHACRPRVLHVACPRCGGRADATKPSEAGQGELIGDLSPSWNLADWAVACSRCVFRAADLAYDGLPPLFYRATSSGTELWAWNRRHLELLLRHLDGESARGDPYEWLLTYARREWLSQNRRAGLARAIRRLLEMEP